MLCEDWAARLHAERAGTLGQEEQEQMRGHQAGCAACAALGQKYDRAVELSRDLSFGDVPADLGQLLGEAVTAAMAEPVEENPDQVSEIILPTVPGSPAGRRPRAERPLAAPEPRREAAPEAAAEAAPETHAGAGAGGDTAAVPAPARRRRRSRRRRGPRRPPGK